MPSSGLGEGNRGSAHWLNVQPNRRCGMPSADKLSFDDARRTLISIKRPGRASSAAPPSVLARHWVVRLGASRTFMQRLFTDHRGKYVEVKRQTQSPAAEVAPPRYAVTRPRQLHIPPVWRTCTYLAAMATEQASSEL